MHKITSRTDVLSMMYHLPPFEAEGSPQIFHVLYPAA